jgi:cation:H+ antiporter
MASEIGVTGTVIGATVIAITTVLPEMSLCFSSIKKKKVNLALGTLIGSAVSEITLIFGSVLVLATFAIDMSIFSTLLMFTLLTNILAWRFFETGRKLDRFEGIILILVYVVFLATTLGVQATLLGLFS